MSKACITFFLDAGISQAFGKILRNSLEFTKTPLETSKKQYFSRGFIKINESSSYLFRLFYENYKVFCSFEEILKFIDKNSIENFIF